MRTKLGLSALVAAIFAYGFHVFLTVQGPSDLSLHIEYASQIRSTADLASPHFLFELLIKALYAAGVGYITATAWILGLSYGGMAFLVAHEIERRGIQLTPARTFVIVPGLLIASHVFLLTVFKPNLYYGYFVPIAYHNPTQQLNKLFAVWIYFIYRAQFLDVRRAAPGPVAAIGVLAMLSAIAKPSFLVAFVPAAGVYGAREFLQRRWRQVALFVVGIALPSALVLLWQARLAFGAEGDAILFEPFRVFNFTQTLYKLPASFAFPIVAGVAAWRHHAVDDRLRFVWLYTAIALFATLALVQEGDVMAGNFAWTGQTAVFLAYVESVLFLLAAPLSVGWRRAAWAVFALHVVCGIAWYFVMFTPSRGGWL